MKYFLGVCLAASLMINFTQHDMLNFSDREFKLAVQLVKKQHKMLLDCASNAIELERRIRKIYGIRKGNK